MIKNQAFKPHLAALLLPLLFSVSARAQISNLSIGEYLTQMKQKNADYKSLEQTIHSLEMRRNESRLEVNPEFFMNYSYVDDRTPVTNSFSPNRSISEGYLFGLRGQSAIGLSGELAFGNSHTELFGVAPGFFDLLDAQNTQASLTLKQQLWRNSFGQATRAGMRMKDLGVDIELHQAKFRLKNLLVQAEILYWTVSSFQKIIDLQKGNVEVAEKTSQLMSRKVRQNLADDVDELQAQAALEARQLELQQSTDILKSSLRQFNKMRSAAPEEQLNLDPVPQSEWKKTIQKYEGTKAKREDFQSMRMGGELTEAQGHMATSNLKPELALYGRAVANGREATFRDSVEELQNHDFPVYEVGMSFSVPLNLGLLSEAQSGYRAKTMAGLNQVQAAEDLESRSWVDAIEKAKDSLVTFERAQALEKLQSQLIVRERKRLSSGRATTFQVLQAEQNLAQYQIQRVRIELQVVQNIIELRSYEVQK
jgi:outer membrane protein TolC